MAQIKRRAGSPYYYAVGWVDGCRICRSTGQKTERAAKAALPSIIAEFRSEISAKADADDAERKRLAAIASGKYVPTVSQICARYWNAHGKRRADRSTVETYLERIVDHVGGDTPYDQVTIADVSAFVDEWRARGLSSSTANRMIAVWRRMHTIADEQWELDVARIRWRHVVAKEPRVRVRYLSDAEREALLDAAMTIGGASLLEIVQWSILTGCRKRETLTLDWSKVDIENGGVSVKTKGGGERWVDISEAAASLLRSIKERRKNSSLVFSSVGLRKRFEAAVRLAGISDFRFHDLRHTFATYLVARGVPVQTIQRALGHTQIATTMRYAHVSRNDVRAAVNLISISTPATAPEPTSKATSIQNTRAGTKFKRRITG